MMLLKAVSAAKTPGIITSNLSLYLSAHNPNSYGGSGSTWTDLSTNANNATLYNTPTYSTDNGGVFDLDGVNDYAEDSSTTGTPFGFGTGAFTWEVWVKYDSISTGPSILDPRRITSPTTSESLTDYITSGGNLRFYRNTSDVFSSTSNLSTGNWYHIVLSRTSTATNQTRLYINNSLDKTATLSESFTDRGRYYVGRIINVPGVYLDGKVAQIRIYKGKGLTAAEVKQNYNAHRRLYGL
jgi:hypothetical protein